MRLRQLALLTALLTGICVFAPAAQAAPDQASIMMDDDLLLYRDNVTQTRTLVTMQSMGADAVRVTMLWRIAAEGASLSNQEIERIKGQRNRERARAQKKRFKPNDPRTYPTRNWDRYDNLVKEATKLGMRVFFTLTGPGPSYAHRTAPPSQRRNAGTYKPYPSRFRSFVEAVGKRYSGTYRDENALRQPLPRVSLWSLWNEPNQPGWLSPQSETVNGQLIPVAPTLYRELHQAGVQGLERSGHGNDAIFLGETAPLGNTKRSPINGIRPVPFLREMLCLRPDGTPYAGADAERRRCHTFNRNPTLKATAFAHHPYTKKANPTRNPSSPDEITMGNIGSLGPLLDTLSAQSGGKIAANLPIFLTEFGYESNPPDVVNGIPLARQAEFNQLAEFIAYNEPRVKATTQFLLRDAGPLLRSPVTRKAYRKNSREYWFTYQSGLYTQRGRAKPAAFAYTLPLVVYPAGPGMVGFWGQLRFRPNTAQDIALLLWCPDENNPRTCVQVGEGVPTAFRNFFSGVVPVPAPGGFYRAAYFIPPTGAEPAKIGAYSLAARLKPLGS
ncbi:MAG: hypothetical protein Q8O56_11360 [Solirubrobacteraceae bacterium]|nr:hypothetical protein [Solirubrobacteraceae bacterium]